MVLDERSGEHFIIPAKAVVLSTGGRTDFARTTNPPNATGDGMAMAFLQGLNSRTWNSSSFTDIAVSAVEPAFLLSEAMRGGQLRNNREDVHATVSPLGALLHGISLRGLSGRKWRRRARGMSILM